MNMNRFMRQFHRWVSMVFTAVVALVFVTLGVGKEPPSWLYLSPLAPLALLMLTGLYMFAMPHAARWRSARRSGAVEQQRPGDERARQA